MRLHRHEEPLSSHAERELAALDDALAGRPVDPDLEDLGELAVMLREERPGPEGSWAAELDERVERRFVTPNGSSWREGLGRLRALPPRRIAAMGMAAVATVAVIGVGVSSISSNGSDGSGDTATDLQPIEAKDLVPASAAPSAASTDAAGASDTTRGATAGNRKVDRDVELKLSSAPEDVSPTADDVIRITRDAGGYVAASQVRTTEDGGGATLHLTIPTRHLDDAIDELTKLANVQSLNEATNDITQPYISAKDKLADAKAEREKLLEALGNATTDQEAEAIRLQLDDVRGQISRAQAEFENVSRRARLSQVDVAVVGDPGTAAKSDGGRSLGDWADDALGVLRDIAGVLLVTAAIVVPLGLLLALIWLAIAVFRRRRRERALEG